jgi:hypothetical protein
MVDVISVLDALDIVSIANAVITLAIAAGALVYKSRVDGILIGVSESLMVLGQISTNMGELIIKITKSADPDSPGGVALTPDEWSAIRAELNECITGVNRIIGLASGFIARLNRK